MKRFKKNHFPQNLVIFFKKINLKQNYFISDFFYKRNYERER